MSEPIDETNFELPESLRQDLRALDAAPRIPSELDRAILNDARAHLARRSRLRIGLRIGGAAALAASVAVAIGVWTWTADRPVNRASVAYDVTGDGRVDIVDALRAAHEHKDRQQIDAIAMAAVRVGEVTP
jgi:hypothetical protein